MSENTLARFRGLKIGVIFQFFQLLPTLTVLEPHIARKDVAAVVLLIRWIRHNLNDVAELCVLHGKPLVRAPGGYNVNQLAKLVVEQRRRRGE